MARTIGILQAGAAPEGLLDEFGDYPAMFERLLREHGAGLDFKVYRALDGELPERVGDADAWLITGSRHSVLDAAPWMVRLEAFVRSIIAGDGRLCGICFGHQLVASAMGGSVDRAAAGWSIGRQCYRAADGDGDDDSIALNAFHQDQVVSLPTGARVLASSDSCPLAVVEYGEAALTIQAHPEFRNDFLSELIRQRLSDKLPPRTIAEAVSSLQTEPDTERVAGMILERLVA